MFIFHCSLAAETLIMFIYQYFVSHNGMSKFDLRKSPWIKSKTMTCRSACVTESLDLTLGPWAGKGLRSMWLPGYEHRLLKHTNTHTGTHVHARACTHTHTHTLSDVASFVTLSVLLNSKKPQFPSLLGSTDGNTNLMNQGPKDINLYK